MAEEIKEEGYGKDKILSMKEIILSHIKKISDICCQELRSGYWEEKPLSPNSNLTSKVYHPDLRLALCNAVDFLLDMVRPYADDIFSQKLREFRTEERLRYKKFKKLAKDDEEEDIIDFKKMSLLYFEAILDKKGYREIKNIWIKIKLNISKRLFGEITLMFQRTNFFEGEEFGE